LPIFIAPEHALITCGVRYRLTISVCQSVSRSDWPVRCTLWYGM